VEFVSQQIILPEVVTRSIIELAAQQDISLNTNLIRIYQSPLNSSSSQNIIIPAKVASANAMYIMFQPQNYLSTTEGQLYNSMSRLCPFSQISSQDTYAQTSAISYPTTTSLYQYSASNGATTYGVGQATPFSTVNCPSASGSFSIQLLLGNELLPQQPITCVTEIVSELLKTQHKLFDTTANVNAAFTLVPNAGFSSSSSYSYNGTSPVKNYGDSTAATQYYFDCLEKDGFCSAFSFAGYLDDQTYINNPNWNYIAACDYNSQMTFTNPANSADADAAANGVGLVSGGISHGVYDLFGARGPYTLPFFTPLESKFMIGFDLDTWSRMSDVARSGRFLGNNTIQLQITNATALNYGAVKNGLIGINMLSMIQFDARLSFQAGGSVVTYY